MPQAVSPGFIPKVALTASRVAVKPFEVPARMTQAALAEGGAAHITIAQVNSAVREGVAALQPRAPLAKAFDFAFSRVDNSIASSAKRAEHATKTFWVPFSEASAGVGQAVAGPGAAFYARKAGFPDPTNPQLLAMLIKSQGFPMPEPEPEPKPAPPASSPPPTTKPPQGSEPATPGPKPDDASKGTTPTGDDQGTKPNDATKGTTPTGDDQGTKPNDATKGTTPTGDETPTPSQPDNQSQQSPNATSSNSPDVPSGSTPPT